MTVLMRLGRYLLALVDELSDQNAYRRFLAARGTTACAREWKLFSERRHEGRYKRAKCC